MINKIELTGFKSFVSDEIDFNQLTILSGLNSSGKSSVIQAVRLLEKVQQTNKVYLPGHGSIAESRNPYLKDNLVIKCTLTNNDYFEFNETGRTEVSSNFKLPDIIHIAADRMGPESNIEIDPTGHKLGSRGENIFNVIEYYADYEIPSVVKHERSQGDTFLFNLESWLNIISPNTEFKSYVERKSDSSYGTFNGHRAKNVGFGLSYALPVITALLLGTLNPAESLVILENPEAHLHPRGQTEIARFICLCAKAGLQILVETHSDHLFDGIRLFAKDAQDDFYTRVLAYWFELDNDRNTDVSIVKFDQHGRIDNWPQGMFDQFSINASKLL